MALAVVARHLSSVPVNTTVLPAHRGVAPRFSAS